MNSIFGLYAACGKFGRFDSAREAIAAMKRHGGQVRVIQSPEEQAWELIGFFYASMPLAGDFPSGKFGSLR